MMSYNQDYNTQPIYELDFNYSVNSDSDNNLSQLAYKGAAAYQLGNTSSRTITEVKQS